MPEFGDFMDLMGNPRRRAHNALCASSSRDRCWLGDDPGTRRWRRWRVQQSLHAYSDSDDSIPATTSTGIFRVIRI